MRRHLSASLHPERTALSYALGRMMLDMRIRRNANSTWRLGVRHHTRKVMRRALRSWNETTHPRTSAGAPDDRRDAPSRHRHAPRLPRPGHRGAPAAPLCKPRRRSSAAGARRACLWRAQSKAARAFSGVQGGASKHGARSARRRALSALRANAVEQRAGKSLARMSLSGREQLAGMETRSAFSVLRTHAQASRRAKTSLLVSSQRGVAMRAAALLQPLRALAVLLQSRALQRASASVCIALDRRVSGLQAVLEAEVILKRRQYEAHQAELDKQRKEQQRQQAAQKLQAEAADCWPRGSSSLSPKRGSICAMRPLPAVAPRWTSSLRCSMCGRRGGCAPRSWRGSAPRRRTLRARSSDERGTADAQPQHREHQCHRTLRGLRRDAF